MKGIRVDPEARTARAQAGVLLGRARPRDAGVRARRPGRDRHPHRARRAHARRRHRVAACASTASRSTSSSSVDLVTAEGELVRASEDENADLFWGVRGGGGNFGIVTEFEFRLNPLGPIVLAGPIFWPMEESPKVLRFYRDWIADAPDELMTIVIHRKAPPLPFVPRRAARQAGGRRRLLLRGPGRGGREGRPAAEGVRLAGARPVRAEAVPRAPGDVRPLVPARLVVLLPRLRRGGAHRRRDRHHGRARAADPVAADGFPIWQMGGASRGWARRDRVQRPRRGPHLQHHRHRPRRPRASTRSASGCATSGRPSSRTTRAST